MVVILSASIEPLLRLMCWKLSAGVDELFIGILVELAFKVLGLHVRIAYFILLINQTIIKLIIA